MSKNNVEIAEENVAEVRKLIEMLKAAKASEASVKNAIDIAVGKLKDDLKAASASVTSLEAALIEKLGLGAQHGTFNVPDEGVKITLPATYATEKPKDAREALAGILGDTNPLVDMVMVPELSFSKRSYDTVTKMTDLTDWFNDNVTVKIGKAKVELKQEDE